MATEVVAKNKIAPKFSGTPPIHKKSNLYILLKVCLKYNAYLELFIKKLFYLTLYLFSAKYQAPQPL